MKFHNLLVYLVMILFCGQLQANQTHKPELVSVSAKYAKLKAKQRSYNSSSSDETISQIINSYTDDNPGSCDLNVGNVIVEDTVGSSPDDVVVIIEGDILQSNNCR